MLRTKVTLQSKVPRLRQQMKLASQVVRKAVRDIRANAQAAAPVDTGFLRNSIQSQMQSELTGEVTVGADYAIYVEFGTSRRPATPFLMPAVERVRPAFEAAMKQLTRVK
ncbi:MAG: HK97-gp10 family putative phage morphogenesis protein [Blastocatellia bacterium]